MEKNQQFCYTHPSGEDIYLFALSNSRGTKVCISNYGAIMQSFQVKQPTGNINDIVLGFDTMEEYTAADYLNAYPWFGVAVGRYANRIKKAHFALDGVDFSLTKNNGDDHLHGGKEGFDKKVWALKALTENSVELFHTSPAGDEGYPGNLHVSIRFELSEQDELSYTYTAVADQATPLNLTHHSYFNLDHGNGTVAGHEVRIKASAILVQDSSFIPNGNIQQVQDTEFDFRQWKKVSAHWNADSGYDQSYIADKTPGDFAQVAEVFSAASNLKLEVWSNEPIVHFYTGQFIPFIKGKNGTQYKTHSGLCLETQGYTNGVNIPDFPTTILRPGEKYERKTLYHVIHTAAK